MSFDLTTINWLAVLVAGFAAFMLGGVWYTALFGKAWQHAHGYDDPKVKELQAKRPPAVFFSVMIVCYFVMAFATAVLVQSAGLNTLLDGAMLGAAVWLLVAAVTLTNHLPTHVTWAGWFIDVSYALVYCLGMGMILAAWR